MTNSNYCLFDGILPTNHTTFIKKMYLYTCSNYCLSSFTNVSKSVCLWYESYYNKGLPHLQQFIINQISRQKTLYRCPKSHFD